MAMYHIFIVIMIHRKCFVNVLHIAIMIYRIFIIIVKYHKCFIILFDGYWNLSHIYSYLYHGLGEYLVLIGS